MPRRRNRSATRRKGCAKGNRIALFYQEGAAAFSAPGNLMPNLATAGGSRPPPVDRGERDCRMVCSGMWIENAWRVSADEYRGKRCISEDQGPKPGCSRRSYSAWHRCFSRQIQLHGMPGIQGALGLTSARQTMMPATTPAAGIAIQMKRLCAAEWGRELPWLPAGGGLSSGAVSSGSISIR